LAPPGSNTTGTVEAESSLEAAIREGNSSKIGKPGTTIDIVNK
jgi:hypothetical protein